MDNNYVQYAEIGTLSIALRNPELVTKIASVVKSHMFTSSPNKTLFSTLVELTDAGVFPDYGTLVTSLQASGKFAECGGDSYLQHLLNQSFNPANIDELCRYIVEGYKARELTTLAANLPTMVSSTTGVDNVVGYVRGFLDNLSEYGSPDNIPVLKDSLRETWGLLTTRVRAENKISVSTNIKKLNDVTGGYGAGDLWVVGARPGMGKSALMCNSILSGVPSLVFSREMSRDSLNQRLIGIQSGVPVFNIRLGLLSQLQLTSIQDAIREIQDYPIFIDSAFSSSIEYIVSTIIKHKSVHDIKVVHIDYLQLLVEREDNATHEIGRITRNLKLLANNLGISIVLYSQLNRNVESRDDKRPALSDLRQSGNIEEDVDVALFLYRDKLYNANAKNPNDLELLLRKQRNGPTGTLTVQFDEVSNKITE